MLDFSNENLFNQLNLINSNLLTYLSSLNPIEINEK